MSLTTTTFSAAVAATDVAVNLTSTTSLAANMNIVADGEQMQVVQGYTGGNPVPVLRGRGGTVTAAHVSGANVTFGVASDFTNPGPGGQPVNWPNSRTRTLTSYSASGAIALPVSGQDAVAIINGTSTLTMTLAAPTKDLDGSILYIQGNGKSASTVAVAGNNGIGNAGAGYRTITLQTGGDVGVSLMAVNGNWNLLNTPITGTTTAISVAIS